MSVLLDTSVVIEVLRGRPAAIHYTSSLKEVPTCSEITRVEVLRGLRSAERDSTERLFRALRWAGVDEAVARRAGEMGRAYRRSHMGVGTSDLIIAATAEELGLKVATLNVKHFPMISGLRAPYRG